MEVSRYLRPRDCPVCGNGDDSEVAYPARIDEEALDTFAFASRKVPEFMHLRLLKCPVCGVLYASPAMPPDFLARAYRDASYDSGIEARYAARTYARQLRSILDETGDREMALEVGAGNGAFLGHLRDAGFRKIVGVEPSEQAAATAEPAIRPLILTCVFHAADFEPSSVSLFSCFQTLEHLENPRLLCLDAYRLLRPGGVIFLVDHDYRSWVTRLMGERSPVFDIAHQQLFSRESLRYVVTSCGFRDVRIGTIWNCYPLAYWIRLLPIPRRLKHLLTPVLNSRFPGRIPLRANVGNLYAIGFKRP
jgi:SAM-dependent methyltransferase